MADSKLINRFLRYVKIDTESSTTTNKTPSTEGQLIFAKQLEQELIEIGLQDVTIDDNGYVMATLPANSQKQIPTIGFVAHMDTSPDLSGKNVNPQIVKKYDGKDIVLNKDKKIVLSVNDFPEILNYVGQDIITTDGNTLLGADDKAGLAEIVTAMEYLIAHPEIEHGKIRIGFTPDEEVGQGADHFDVKRFGAEWAYTVDGGQIGELEYENFNAAGATIAIKGRNVHPGTAKGKMVNALTLATKLTALLPELETPENTEEYEGFFHLIGLSGSVDEANVSYIIRDHDRSKFEEKKIRLQEIVAFLNKMYNGAFTLTLKDQYYNMKEKVEPVKHIVDIAFQAMEQVGVTPIVKPIRGGTDGARLSFMGLPCPNIFGGGHNFHGRFEYVPIPSMHKAMAVIIQIVSNLAK